jgi:hypothetical protein
MRVDGPRADRIGKALHQHVPYVLTVCERISPILPDVRNSTQFAGRRRPKRQVRAMRPPRACELQVRFALLEMRLLIVGCTAYESHEVETRSRPDAFPSVLQLKRTTQTKEHIDGNVKTKVSLSSLLGTFVDGV